MFEFVSPDEQLISFISFLYHISLAFPPVASYIHTYTFLSMICYLCIQCMHGPKCKLGNFCTVGRRIQEVNVLGGLILPVWGTIENALSKQVCCFNF